jgi:hypothetical protein
MTMQQLKNRKTTTLVRRRRSGGGAQHDVFAGRPPLSPRPSPNPVRNTRINE